MKWFNLHGLIFVALLMIPNILFALKYKNGFENNWKNKYIEGFEQIGRYGCFFTMIFNIPYTCFGYCSENAFWAYCIINTVLVASYCLIWCICFRKNSLFRALSLSILPSVLFLFSGILCRSVLLTVFAAVFAPCHILISYRNAKQ